MKKFNPKLKFIIIFSVIFLGIFCVVKTSRASTLVLDEVRMYDRVLSQSEITDLYRAGAARMKANSPPSAPFGNSGLVGYWSFNGQDTNWTSATAGTTNDLSGNNNTGTMTNMARSSSPVPGISGQALSFDGVDDYVFVDDVVDSISSWTYTAWIKLKNINKEQHIVELQGSQFYVRSDNKLSIVAASNNTALQANKWYFVSVTRTPSASNFYLNGLADGGGAAGTGTWSPPDAYIGRYYLSAGYFFDGLIDEVRIYNRALGADEILQLYRLGTRKFQPTQ